MPHRGMRLAAELIGWWASLFLIYLVFISTLSPLELFVGAAVSGLAAAGAWAIHRAVRPEVGPAAHWMAAVWAWPGTLLTETALLASALATAALWGRRVPGHAAQRLRELSATGTRHLVRPLRRLHCGRLGDNVAWLATGVAALLAAITALK